MAATGETEATIARAAVAVDAEVSAGASVGAGAGVEALLLLLLTSKMCASLYVFSLYSIRSFPEAKKERFRNARSTHFRMSLRYKLFELKIGRCQLATCGYGI